MVPVQSLEKEVVKPDAEALDTAKEPAPNVTSWPVELQPSASIFDFEIMRYQSCYMQYIFHADLDNAKKVIPWYRV